MNQLPNGWKRSTLGEIAHISSGGTPSRSQPEYWENGDIPWIRTTEVQNCILYPENTQEFITGKGLQNSSAKLVATDTILLAMIGQGKTRGQVALLKFEASTNQNCATIQLYKNHSSDFYFQYLLSQYENIRGSSNSAGQSNLSGALVKAIPVPVPPLSEQIKIAQILTTWDNAIRTTEQLIQNSEQQKQALMQQLLTGKKRLFDEHGKRFCEEWKYLSFEECFKVSNDKSIQIKSSEYKKSGNIPVIDQSQSFIAGYCDSLKVYSDIPVIIFGDHTRCLKWIDFEFCIGADGTQVLKTKNQIDEKFAYYALCNTYIPNLGYSRHMRELKEKDFKMPVNVEEQQKIAAVLTATDNEIDTLKQTLCRLKTEKQALMQQLLTGKRRVFVNCINSKSIKN